MCPNVYVEIDFTIRFSAFLQTLQKHYHPDVAKAAMLINKPLSEQEEDISEVLELTVFEVRWHFLLVDTNKMEVYSSNNANNHLKIIVTWVARIMPCILICSWWRETWSRPRPRLFHWSLKLPHSCYKEGEMCWGSTSVWIEISKKKRQRSVGMNRKSVQTFLQNLT